MDSVATAHGCLPGVTRWTSPPLPWGVHLIDQTVSSAGPPVITMKSGVWNPPSGLGWFAERQELEIFTYALARLRRNRQDLAACHRCGTTVISRSAAIRSSSGGCVLKSEERVSEPNMGLTIHRAEVVGDIAVVGMRLLYAPSFCKALMSP